MRKVVLGASVSLDGYLARPDGTLDFLRMPKGFSMAAMFANVDTIAFGRKTFDIALKWGGGSYKPPIKIPTYVFSRSAPPGERQGVTFTAEAPKDFVTAMRKEQTGKDIFVMGGGELARAFLIDDAVDELDLSIHPLLLGAGIPFFPPGFPERAFKLIESKNYEPDGILKLRYARR